MTANTLAQVLFGNQEYAQGSMENQLPQFISIAGVSPRELAEATWQVLDLPLGDVVFKAWDKYDDVSKACEATKGHPGARKVIEIHSHTLRSVHRPRIEIYVNGAKVSDVNLELELSLNIQAVTVTVTAGEISEIGPSSAIAEASLKGPLGTTLVPVRPIEVSLPGSIRTTQS